MSLSIVLNYLGYENDPVWLSDNYLPKGEYWIDSPYEKYIGDPKSVHGSGCYAPCITDTANRFLRDNDADYECVDISGSDFTVFEDYINKGYPVIIWGTTFMDCSDEICYSYWNNYTELTWYMHSHCLVMIGYSSSTYVFCDPLVGISDYEKESVVKSYEQEFSQACVIVPKAAED